MCGIGLIASGVALEGDALSDGTASSGAPACLSVGDQYGETASPNVSDLCGALRRRGPDHIGGATLHVWPLKQHLEMWKHSKAEEAVCRGSMVVDQSFRELRTEDNESEIANRRMLSVVPNDEDCSARLHVIGATLQLRGDHLVVQPIQDSLGNLLVFNGEIFGGLVVRGSENDTEVLMSVLGRCCGCDCHSTTGRLDCKCRISEKHQTVPEILSRLRGPWAFIYWQALSQTLWFGRDAIGRRSLLIHSPSFDDPRLLVTSVAPDAREDISGSLKYWEELICGFYSVRYSVISEVHCSDKSPRSCTSAAETSSMNEGPLNGSCLVEEHTSIDDKAVRGSRKRLMGWAKRHSWQDPFLKSLLAWERRYVTPMDIDIPVSSQGQLIDHQDIHAKDAVRVHEGQKYDEFSVDRTVSQMCISGKSASNDAICQDKPKQKLEVHKSPVERVLVALCNAVARRTTNIRQSRDRSQSHTDEKSGTELSCALKGSAPVAVLFSGGLDSMILAALANQMVHLDCCIDLLNVSFDGSCAPDRITAVAGVTELREVFPSRRWRLIEIDAELSAFENCRIHRQSLLCPSNTYMDLNIGTALWVAASGEGYVNQPPSCHDTLVTNKTTKDDDDRASTNGRQYAELVPNQRRKEAEEHETSMADTLPEGCHVRSEARVLLVGSGADEQCGGYGRHRTKFRLGGWRALEEEMRLDFTRLWKRNLGRDDRCIADQGKEARFPFLDEEVISTLLSLPLWEVVDLHQPEGTGDKKVLRQVAQHLGLTKAASLPKRAIQFGSRIARESNRKDFGSNRAANQASAGSAHLKK